MNWTLLDDPANRENRNTGNGGDLVKHTVYLATLRFLLARKPWSEALFLRECHAGRGMYRITDPARQHALSRLYAAPTRNDQPVLLQRAQRTIMDLLGCDPDEGQPVEWYAGSAVINALTLATSSQASLDFYEFLPETRRILRCVLNSIKVRPQLNIPPQSEAGQLFDGEDYIVGRICEWGKQDVVMLDPFAMCREKEDQAKRNLYGAIVDHLIDRGNDAPCLILFWTWGRTFPVSDGDLNGPAMLVRNGYAELLAKFHCAGWRFITVKWRWGLQFAMWIIVPSTLAEPLSDEIRQHCCYLRDHLILGDPSDSPSYSPVEIAVA